MPFVASQRSDTNPALNSHTFKALKHTGLGPRVWSSRVLVSQTKSPFGFLIASAALAKPSSVGFTAGR